jgi:hypothetical protein
MKELEEKLRSLLKGEHTSITINFNDHKGSYVKTAEAVIDGTYDYADWVSDDEKRKAVETDSVWTLQWYPETPIGFYCLAASSLDAVVRAALGEGKE